MKVHIYIRGQSDKYLASRPNDGRAIYNRVVNSRRRQVPKFQSSQTRSLTASESVISAGLRNMKRQQLLGFVFYFWLGNWEKTPESVR